MADREAKLAKANSVLSMLSSIQEKARLDAESALQKKTRKRRHSIVRGTAADAICPVPSGMRGSTSAPFLESLRE